VRAYLVDDVSPNEPAHNEDGSPRVVFYQKKRLAEQAAVACFIAGEGGPSDRLHHGEWLEGVSADMPAWIIRAIARRVDLVEQGLEMDFLSTSVGQIMDFKDDDDEDAGIY
jgi:hypothetical protein